MKKVLLLSASMLVALLMAGCSEPIEQQDQAQRQNASKQQQAAPKQEKTVVVNEGMSKKEEEKLNERLAELEEKVDDRPPDEQTTQAAEGAALTAAQDYYAAAAAGNYNYTYDALTSTVQSQFSEEYWVAANTALGSDAGIYHIDSTDVADDSTVNVYLTITSADGSSSERATQFVLENGSWKHELTQSEYELFAGATATATASGSTSAGAEPPEENVNQAPASQEDGSGVVFRVAGDPGVRFQGSISTMDISKSVQGTTPQDFPLKDVDTGFFSTDIVSCNAQKMAAGGGELTVQILVDGEVVKQANTTAQYGLAQVTWSPAE